MPAQGLHVDVIRDSADWPLVGFILMVDEFRPENGATRFVPGSQRWTTVPEGHDAELQADRDDQALACGPAGSLLIFNGSAWHGHTGNVTDAPRRSIHGAFIPRGGRAATEFAGRMTAETRGRLSALAIDLLAIP
jgi:ectoine hydroxylase-related dioxygenase (phytanoyl-CoA dioxygenase family)